MPALAMTEHMVKTFEFKIRTTAAFTKAAALALEASRFTYNCALEQRIMRYQQGKPIGYFEQSRELTKARELPEVRGCLRAIQADALERLDFAFKTFFRRVQVGQTPGYPRFKGKCGYSTFSQKIKQDYACPLRDDLLKVPGVGSVRIRLSRPIEGKVKQLRITRRADGWYALLVCEMPTPEPLPKTGSDIGMDVGLTSFATLSTGETIQNPRHLRRAEKALKRSQRVLSRKLRQSANRTKARQRLALRHLKVQRARKDFHHKTALDLVRRFDSIKVEDLQITNMLLNHKLSKSISDAAWGQFLAITQFKAENAGRVFEKVDPRYTTQTCSACGHRQNMPLSVRLFVCEMCSHSLNRDHNAAINIGRSAPELTPAESRRVHGSRNRHVPDTKMPADVNEEE